MFNEMYLTCEVYCRDLLYGKKDNLLLKKIKSQGIFVSGVTKIRFLFGLVISSLYLKAIVSLMF